VVHLAPEELSVAGTPVVEELDPEALRLDQNFVEIGGTRKLINDIVIRQPPKQEFVWAHPDPKFSQVVGILELKEEKEIFVVTPAIAKALGDEIYHAQLTTAITRHEVLFLWLAKVPTADNSVALASAT
jgi:hypothetical protein